MPQTGNMEPQFHQNPQETFLSRIRAVLPELHRAERKLGTFLLDFPGDLASYDAQELARLSGVSKATVSRFIRRIGFENYEVARRAARDERQTGSRHFLAHAENVPTESQLSVSVQEEIANVAWTFERIDTAELEALAEAILASRRVWLIGYRISRIFADYLYWQLLKVVPSATVIPQAGESLGEYTAEMTPEDVVILVALRRKAANTDPLIAECQRQGGTTALVTDEGHPPDHRARWHFRCRIETSSPQFNHASVMSLCHQIVTRTTVKAGRDAQHKLRLIDEANERLGEV
ncbi:MurR/RpiR family transcriptional regulator [Celeribacter neptunius]|uniref:Transcriptional regulator, RpiR family n=1 Tax=Celeribacter neptunius TaxID=588602 RepID=A0A1I3IH50_9RHOB|nr:MurR/RpiR family transcriptional regulator [Celeribacter neptunius]SFI47318.1 transcriptional regulator, RpiR family [Celeribacter neptunius]